MCAANSDRDKNLFKRTFGNKIVTFRTTGYKDARLGERVQSWQRIINISSCLTQFHPSTSLAMLCCLFCKQFDKLTLRWKKKFSSFIALLFEQKFALEFWRRKRLRQTQADTTFFRLKAGFSFDGTTQEILRVLSIIEGRFFREDWQTFFNEVKASKSFSFITVEALFYTCSWRFLSVKSSENAAKVSKQLTSCKEFIYSPERTKAR